MTHSFSSKPEIQGGKGNKEHNEKVLLNLEEVKVRNMPTSLFRHVKVVWDAVSTSWLFVLTVFSGSNTNQVNVYAVSLHVCMFGLVSVYIDDFMHGCIH